MTKHKQALIWITKILNKHKLKYEVTGGLAARAYGATRPLYDIDIMLAEEDFDKIIPDVKKYIVEGPHQSKTKIWDCYFLELKYKGIIIEFGGAYKTKFFDKTKKRWTKDITNLEKSIKGNVLGVNVSLTPKDDLIKDKGKMGRKTDLLDIKQIQKHDKGDNK